MRLGDHTIATPVFAAPMAGISDRPYRAICRDQGASLAFSEMVSSRPEHRSNWQTRIRLDHEGEAAPVAIQVVGTEPGQLAEMAQIACDQGAEIVDINMGCPSKRVCNRLAGSALLSDKGLVSRILDAVVAAVDVPVTLKIRTGVNRENRNAVSIANIAEAAGVSMLTVHGRTRQCRFRGEAEYDTIALVKQAVAIPVVANGDIDNPRKARAVLERTGADAVMIGRGAQGRPWLFRQVSHYLETGKLLSDPPAKVRGAIMMRHLRLMYEFYGEEYGVRLVRKHIANYLKQIAGTEAVYQQVIQMEDAGRQLDVLEEFFDQPCQTLDRAA